MTPYGITSVTGIKSTKCPLSPGWREQEHTLPISHISISFPLQRGYSPTVLLSSTFSSEKAYFTEILLPAAAQQCFLPTGHPSNAALFLYRASRVSMHSILQQPRFSELTSLDIRGRVCLFSRDADHLQPSVPSQSASAF